MKKILSLIAATVILFSLMQMPVSALSREQNAKATEIANQIVDSICEAAELQLSTENLEEYLNKSLADKFAQYAQDDIELNLDPDFGDVLGKRILRKMVTRCPRKMLAWIGSQSSESNSEVKE